MIYKNNISDKKDYYLYFLLFFTPLINFIVNNLIYYNIDYFWTLIIFISSIFILVIILLKIFSTLKIRLEIFELLFFYLWYFQFYFRDFYHYFDLSLNGDLIQKYSITLCLILISIIFLFLNRFKKFNIFIKSFLIISILINVFSNFYNLKPTKWNYKASKEVLPFENKNTTQNKQNIYFIIMDTMTSKIAYKDLGLDLSDEIKKFEEYGYDHLSNSKSNYKSTSYTLGALFNMDYYPPNIPIGEKSFYPNNLYQKEKPLLLHILEKSNFNFFYLDNSFKICQKTQYINCINLHKKGLFYKVMNDEALSVFLYKSYLNRFFYKYKFEYKADLFSNTEIDYFKNFLVNNKKIISKKNNFFFIHVMVPHYPYRNKDCAVLSSPYINNIKNYLSSSKCAIKKMNEIILLLNEIDSDATVVFQSDEGYTPSSYQKSLTGENNKKKFYEIFNIIKMDKNCRIDKNIKIGNIETIRFVMSCMLGKNYYNEESKEYFVKERSKKKGTIFNEFK